MASPTGFMKKRKTIWRNSGSSQQQPASWEKLKKDYKIRVDQKGQYSVFVATEAPSFGSGFMDTVNSTVHECKVFLSHVCPYVKFQMRCEAVLQEQPDSKSFGLAVVCYSSKKSPAKSWQQQHRVVGGCMHPKMMTPGRIRVRLLSAEFEADTQHGEHPSLSKEDSDFRGGDFEKQFACRFKNGTSVMGVFGKVLVEQVNKNGATPIFEFNLTKVASENENETENDVTDRWSYQPIKELASMLHITEDENWRTLATHIGFTDYEIETRMSGSSDPFRELVLHYQSRGRSPEDFVKALYEVSRLLHVGGYLSKNISEDSCYSSLGFRSTPPSAKNFKVIGDFGDDYYDDDGPAERVTTLHYQGFPPTPPKTPRKRLASGFDESPSCSKKVRRCILPDDHATSPMPRMRRQSSADTLILPVAHEETAPAADRSSHVVRPAMRRASEPNSADTLILEPEDIAERTCTAEMDPSTLWHVSGQLHSKWKSLGRNLNVPEDKLLCIEYEHRDLRECCYQMLMQWKNEFPEKFTYGVLYTALCTSGFKSVACKFCVKRT